ncbi:MAG: hypothetical protein ACI9EW_003297 [Cellvibrionaceae bacterium]|jgi:hypothetical protein
MIKKLLTTFSLALVFIITSLGLIGCSVAVRGSGDVIEESRDATDFDRIALDGVGEIILIQGDHYSLVIEAEDNLMEYIKTDVRGDELTIRIQSRRPIMPTEPLKFFVTTPNLEAVSVDGAGFVSIDELDTNSLELSIDGSAQMNIDQLEANSVAVNINGLGDLNLSGNTDSLEIEIDGAGTFDGKGLESNAATVDINGMGSATLSVENNLDVNVDGSGRVAYYGHPRVTQDINGFGQVVQK